MFTTILKKFQTKFPKVNLLKLIYLLARHIELDTDEHVSMTMKIINELCGNDGKKYVN
jgi:hypothetical protein